MAGAEPLPPLRVRNAGGSPNVIPVFDMIVSGATLTRQGAGVIQLLIDSGAGATGAPVGAAYVTYQTDPTLSAELVLTSGTGLVVSSDTTKFYVSLSTPVVVSSGGTGASTFTAFGVLYGSGASAVQALPTMASGTLIVGSGTNFRPHVLAAGGEATILQARSGSLGGMLWVGTTVYVLTSRTISTTAPLAGGGDLTADRTFTADTAALVMSGRTISVAGGALAGGGNLSADRTITLGTPVAVGSGGTGQVTLTAFGVLYGSGASAVQAIAAMATGSLIVGSGTTVAPYILGVGSGGQYLITSGGTVSGLAWIGTAAAGGSGTVTAGSSQNVAIYSADGTTVDDVTPMGSGHTLLGANTGATAHVYIALSAGANITITHTNSAMLLAATTGGPGTGTVNSGSATYLAYYPSAGTTVDDVTITATTGAGIAQFNVVILTANAASVAEGDMWVVSTSNRLFLAVRSNATNYFVEFGS